MPVTNRVFLIDMLRGSIRSTKEEFHEFYKIPDDSDIEVVHNGCDARVSDHPTRIMKGNNSLMNEFVRVRLCR